MKATRGRLFARRHPVFFVFSFCPVTIFANVFLAGGGPNSGERCLRHSSDHISLAYSDERSLVGVAAENYRRNSVSVRLTGAGRATVFAFFDGNRPGNMDSFELFMVSVAISSRNMNSRKLFMFSVAKLSENMDTRELSMFFSPQNYPVVLNYGKISL